MKNFKKVLAIILAMAMFFALSMTAFAATIVNHTQDANYLTLAVDDANSLTYSAVTVQGNGNNIPDVTTYSYYAKFASNYSSLESVEVSAAYPENFDLYFDDDTDALFYDEEDGIKTSVFNVDFSEPHTLTLDMGIAGTRTYLLSGGVSGTELPAITIQIDISDAIAEYSNLSSTVKAAVDYIVLHCGMTGGQMAAVTISNLPDGSTAMDALVCLCEGTANYGNASVYMNNVNISAGGLGLALAGTYDNNNQLSYISGIGQPNSNNYLSEFSTGYLSGWLYLDPSTTPNYGAAQYYLTGGESFIWLYVNDFTQHINFGI